MKKLMAIGAGITLAVLLMMYFAGAPAVKAEAATSKTLTFQDTKYPKGKKIYEEKCIVCHQANGQGIKGAFPPLDNADYLLEDKVRAVEQVLNGSNEVMVVNGVTYKTPMPPQVDNKEDAVAVINYVLNAWSNDGGTVSMEDVEHIKIKR